MKLTITALVVALCGLIMANIAYYEATRPQPKPAPLPPLGVCVMLNPNFADTTVTAAVSQAVRVNGVVSCEAGSYVPVTPQ